MLDLHNHILPGLDDGPDDWWESLEMARLAVADGIRGVVCTPHWVAGFYENSRDQVLKTVAVFRQKLLEQKISLEVYPGCELHADLTLLQRVKRRELLTLNDSGRYVLLEFPYETLPDNSEILLWDLLTHDIVPVVAHPERNSALLRDVERLRRWIRMGVLVQITAGSMLGRFGSRVQAFCSDILERQMVHVVASDAHGLHTRAPTLSTALAEIQRRLGKAAARSLVFDNPRKIIQGKVVKPPEPLPAKARSRLSGLRKRLFSFRSAL